jgi:hypothetical protein
LSANLLNLPVRQINGGADPLIAEPPATASAARLDELGYDYRYWLLLDRGHEAGGYAYDCVYVEALDYVRNRNPARVVFSVDSSLDVVDPETGIDLRFDSAYWVSKIRARDLEQLAIVDAESSALPRHEEEVIRIDRMLDNIDHGADLCGENPEVQTGDRWHERAIEIARGEELPRSDEMVVELTNVAEVAVDVSRAGFDPAADGVVRVISDGAALVKLTGLASGGTVSADGEEQTAGEDGTAEIPVDQGETSIGLFP